MTIRPVTYVLVGLGSGLGASLRLLLSAQLYQPEYVWPWATLLVNVFGSFLMVFYASMVGSQGHWKVSEPQKQFVLAGLCGGFTTFSVFSLELGVLWIRQQWFLAGGYLLASVCCWLLAIWLGYLLATKLTKRMQIL
ncbi:CrcB family protein [Alkalimonas collagenimarina]|uniref:Fluoride-specific ion channel FluC n=1 Tax=Alkalimonas collagenimarina TaxID=400390 RepID=A0ABT9H1V3_9GAMM|nr:CrcB family protein [Alkalimonas collagenimarina]MDP4537299.1 CrcB family protein [Alkalimonas collagenimarina]